MEYSIEEQVLIYDTEKSLHKSQAQKNYERMCRATKGSLNIEWSELTDKTKAAWEVSTASGLPWDHLG